MHRIDSDGATVDNKFTEGNAALSIPATVVSAAIANAWQEELASFIETMNITLLTSSTDTFDQLYAAVQKLIEQGNRPAPIAATIANNTGPAAVAGFPALDSSTYKAFEAVFTIERSTDSSNVVETGKLYCTYNSAAGAWVVDTVTLHGDAGVLLSESGEVLQYTSNDLTGTSYAGEIRIIDVKKILIA